MVAQGGEFVLASRRLAGRAWDPAATNLEATKHSGCPPHSRCMLRCSGKGTHTRKWFTKNKSLV
jgi:hypothetical protein